MPELDRLKELEKLAEDLGLNEPKEVGCISCKKKIKSNEAVVITKKGEKVYICEDCYKKLEEGELTKKQDWPSILRGLKEQEDKNKQPVPMLPKDYPPVYPNIGTGGDIFPKITWKKFMEDEWTSGTGGVRYQVKIGTAGTDTYGMAESSANNLLLKFEPKK